MSVSSFCNVPATLMKHTTAADQYGAQVRSWRKAGSLAIAVWQMTAVERDINGRNGVDATHYGAWVVPVDVNVTNEDRLTVPKPGGTRTFRIVFVEEVQEMGRHVEAKLQEIERDAS